MKEMLRPVTLLIYCGYNREWSDDEMSKLVELCFLEQGKKYNLLLLDVCTNNTDWENHSLDMLGRLSAQAMNTGLPMPEFYVASWGTESEEWINQVDSFGDGGGFLGLYWNGGEERPERPPPSEPYHGKPWKLWIPYSAGTWGIGNVAEAVATSGFSKHQIALQPNVYQPQHNEGWWDMVRCYYYARKYGIKLEMEFNEQMHSNFRYYKWLNKISPKIFTCVYGGLKHILDIEEVL